MRTYQIGSPNAAEKYFNNGILGHICMLLAETLGSLRRPMPRAGRPAAAERAEKRTELPGAGWLERLDAWYWRQEQKEREAYLAKARDVFDLERRIEALDRQGFSRYY